ncbi:MAG: aldehyde-activating protein [Sphingomonadales bacterium 32-64-17]|nr:MAG: aldehyde-activating protein [Sphingomonadales bacterium 32-64-17]
MITGGCRCGAVRYEAEDESAHHALCHCRDCQMAHGAPVVGWIAFKTEQVRFSGAEPVRYTAASGSTRSFCGTCGTPLAFVNEEALPGIVDLPSVTLDDPDALAPQAQIQVAERRAWMADLAALPEFARYPGG